MKKYLLLLILVVCFGSSSLASSFGVHFNFATLSLATIGLQYTVSDVFGGDLRARVNFSAASGGFGVNLQTDLLFNAIVLDPEGKFNVYYGGGIAVGYASVKSGNVNASAFVFGAQTTGGISYFVSPEFLVFFEGSTGYRFGIVSGSSGGSSVALPIFGTVYVVGIGVTYRF
jgi:hypothetical protein